MENNTINNELEQMRQQLQMLHDKLDKQEIISDKMVRNAVNAKMSWIKKYTYMQMYLLVPFCAAIWLGLKYMVNLSWYCYAFMVIMTIVDSVWDYRINIASLKAEEVEKNSLKGTMQKLIDMKQMRKKSFAIMLPLVIVWLAWVGIEMWQNLGDLSGLDDALKGAAHGGFIGLLIGLPVGIFAAWRIYSKMQRTNDEAIAQIKELTNEE